MASESFECYAMSIEEVDEFLKTFTEFGEKLKKLAKKRGIKMIELLTHIYGLYGKINRKVVREYLWVTNW